MALRIVRQRPFTNFNLISVWLLLSFHIANPRNSCSKGVSYCSFPTLRIALQVSESDVDEKHKNPTTRHGSGTVTAESGIDSGDIAAGTLVSTLSGGWCRQYVLNATAIQSVHYYHIM